MKKRVKQDEGTPAGATKTINLALQGGGAHGAFTWGVLDRLIEEDGIVFDGISATSAGAANATAMAYGMTIGGREGARQTLHDLWWRISQAALFSPFNHRSTIDSRAIMAWRTPRLTSSSTS